MDIMFIGMIHLGMIVALFQIGKKIAKADNKTILSMIEKIKIGELKDVSPRYTANYIGYLIEFSGFPYLGLMSGGLSHFYFYLAGAIAIMAALVFHVASAANITPFEAWEKLNFGKNLFSGNVFVRFSVVSAATLLATGAFICYIIKPLLLP